MGQVTKDLVHAGWRVEAEGKLIRPAGEFKLALSTGIDWFDLDGGIDYGGQSVSLPDLLSAARRGETMIELGDGSMGMLPEEWLKKYGMLADLGARRERHPAVQRVAGRRARCAAGQPARDPGRRGLREGPREPPPVRGGRGARLAAGLPRRAAALPARGPGLARLPPAVRLRRDPGRRHGSGQDDPGSGPAPAAAVPPPGQGANAWSSCPAPWSSTGSRKPPGSRPGSRCSTTPAPAATPSARRSPSTT